MSPHVLRDSLDLIRILQGLHCNADEQIMLTAADVNALYPVYVECEELGDAFYRQIIGIRRW
jgi:hypothetical protein